MNIVCLTGWQQEPDALAGIAPDALHFEYGAYDNVHAMFKALPDNVDLAIGWSLGGQLLVRAIAEGYIKTDRLLLLSASFQCIAKAHFSQGMPEPDFRAIKNSYRTNPQEMLARFQALAGIGGMPDLWDNGLFWLEELGRTSCRTLDFSNFPETWVIHSTNDAVVSFASAEEFVTRIPSSTLFPLRACGHAPHLRNSDLLIRLIHNV